MNFKKIFLVIFLVIVLAFFSINSNVFAYTITSQDDYLYSYTADRFGDYSYLVWEHNGDFYCIIPCER